MKILLVLFALLVTNMAAAADVYFKLVDIVPDANRGAWSIQGATIQYYESNIGSAGYAWTAMPDSLQMNQSWGVQMAVRAQSLPTNRFSTGIGMRLPGGWAFQPADPTAQVNSENGHTAENSVNVYFTAPSYGRRGDKYYFKIEAFYGVGVTYVYEAFEL